MNRSILFLALGTMSFMCARENQEVLGALSRKEEKQRQILRNFCMRVSQLASEMQKNSAQDDLESAQEKVNRKRLELQQMEDLLKEGEVILHKRGIKNSTWYESLVREYPWLTPLATMGVGVILGVFVARR